MPAAVFAELAAFVRRWHLPRDRGVDDLHATLWFAHRGSGWLLRLDSGNWGGAIPTIGRTAEELQASGVEPPSDGADRWPLLCPPRLRRSGTTRAVW